MHETFARLTTTSLSAQLRSLVHVRVASVDQLTYEEFIRSIPNPTTLAVINMDPLKGAAILEIDPSVTFSIIDRLFGGKGEETKLSRDLTDIEQSVMENIIVRVLGNLREAWSTVIDLRPRLGQIETNPQFAQIVPPTEMVVLVTLEDQSRRRRRAHELLHPIPHHRAHHLQAHRPVLVLVGEAGRRPRHPRHERLKAEARILFEAEKLSLADVFGLKRNSREAGRLLDRLPGCGRRDRLPVRREEGKGGHTFSRRHHSRARRPRARRRFPVRAAGRVTRRVSRLAVRAPLEKLAGELRSALDQMSGKIAAMQKRQEELGDQLFQNGRGRDNGAGAAADRGRPFAFIGADDRDALYNFIQLEHPQTVALVLSFLDPGMAAELLAHAGRGTSRHGGADRPHGPLPSGSDSDG